jgi:hypothetical protein
VTWRTPSRDDRTVAWYWALCAALTIAASPLAPIAARFAPSCLWHAWTGLPCPTCGATRAVVRLSHLDWGGALEFNPLVTLAVVGFVIGGLLAPAWVGLGGRVPAPASRPRPAILAVVLVALAANWVWLVAAGV